MEQVWKRVLRKHAKPSAAKFHIKYLPIVIKSLNIET